MFTIDVAAVPPAYIRPIDAELRGSIAEVSYSVYNYIDESRRLVTNQDISTEEVGRETVRGEAITKKCIVYLPAGYDQDDPETRYNVLYLLHGVGGNRFEWLNGGGQVGGNYVICNILDNLIANGEIDPVIVVFPEGRSAHNWTDTSFNAAGTNLLGFYYFDYELRYDLIPFIESTYNTYADISDISPEGIERNRKHRAIAGLSMGGMQALNLAVGGYRCDSSIYTGTPGAWGNWLDTTVLAPGMEDLFAYVGAFSQAPTSSDGKTLGVSIASSSRGLDLLYVTCGDADGVAFRSGYAPSIDGLAEAAGDKLRHFYQVVMAGGGHDFKVWNNGAYNFVRLAFGKLDGLSLPQTVEVNI